MNGMNNELEKQFTQQEGIQNVAFNSIVEETTTLQVETQ